MAPPPPPPAVVNCGELRDKDHGRKVEMTGRILRRSLVKFAELRDSHGATQIVTLQDQDQRLAYRIAKMPQDSIVKIVGTVVQRPLSKCIKTQPTGSIEVRVEKILDFEPPAKSNPKRTFQHSLSDNHDKAVISTEISIARSDNILRYFENRQFTCNDLREEHVGKTVTLVGWIPRAMHSKFQQLRDGYGTTQIVAEEQLHRNLLQVVGQGDVVLVKGEVKIRPPINVNSMCATGKIEVLINELKILDPKQPYEGLIVKKTPKKIRIPKKFTLNLERNSSKFTCRTHTCDDLKNTKLGEQVIVCGWLKRIKSKRSAYLCDNSGTIKFRISEILAAREDFDNIPRGSILKINGRIAHKMKNNSLTMKIIAYRLEVIKRVENKFHLLRRNLKKGEKLKIRSTVLMKIREFLINKMHFIELDFPLDLILKTQIPSGVEKSAWYPQYLAASSIDRYFEFTKKQSVNIQNIPNEYRIKEDITNLHIGLSFVVDIDDISRLIERLLEDSWIDAEERSALTFDQLEYSTFIQQKNTLYRTINLTKQFSENILYQISGGDIAAFGVILNTRKSSYLWSNIDQEYSNCQCNLFLVEMIQNEILVKYSNTEVVYPKLCTILKSSLNIENDDSAFIVFGQKEETEQVFNDVILWLTKNERTVKKCEFKWIRNPPLFKQTKNGEFKSFFNIATAPHTADMEKLNKMEELSSIRSQAIILYLNNKKVGEGIISINDYDLQMFVLEKILKIPIDPSDPFLESFLYGNPSHGRFLLNLDKVLRIFNKKMSKRK